MRVKSIDDLPLAIRRQLLRPTEGTAVAAPASGNKFKAQRVEFMGITFDSKWECQRYQELLQLERVDQIQDLHVHVPFGLHVRTPTGETVRIATYIADFQYWREGRMCLEDAKGAPTRKKADFILKRKHVEAEYAVQVIEVERSRPRFGVAA